MCIAISMIPVGIITGINGFKSTSLILISLIILVTFVISFVIAYFISRSIEKLTKNIDEISKGKLDVNLEKSDIYEINKLTESLDRIMASLKLAVMKVGVKKDEIFEENTASDKTWAPNIEKPSPEIGFDSFFTIDENANILECDDKIYKKLGYSKDEILNLNLSDFDVLESKESLIMKINDVKKQGSISYKTIFKKKNGSPFLVYESVTYLPDENKFKCLIREDSKKF